MSTSATLSVLADQWGIHRQQFWLRGQQPAQPVRFEPSLGMWSIHGHAEAQRILSDPAIFSWDTSRLVPDLAGKDALAEGNLVQMDRPGTARCEHWSATPSHLRSSPPSNPASPAPSGIVTANRPATADRSAAGAVRRRSAGRARCVLLADGTPHAQIRW